MPIKELRDPFESETVFASFAVANFHGTTELDGHIGLTIHVSQNSRLERRRDGQTRLSSPQVASSFIDLPGSEIEVAVHGSAAVLQNRMSISRLQRLASEDHDCVLRLDRLAVRQDIEDIELLRLALCTRRTVQHRTVVERELVRRLVHLAGGRPVDWKGGLSPRQLRRLDHLVHDRILDITVSEMAAAAGLTIHHFNREFRRITGSTPWAHVIEQKIKRAVGLLRLTNLATSEIAAFAGFSHASHLSRHMHAQLGLTPSELRNALRG